VLGTRSAGHADACTRALSKSQKWLERCGGEPSEPLDRVSSGVRPSAPQFVLDCRGVRGKPCVPGSRSDRSRHSTPSDARTTRPRFCPPLVHTDVLVDVHARRVKGLLKLRPVQIASGGTAALIKGKIRYLCTYHLYQCLLTVRTLS
jgi:hypothetical protein